MSFRFEMIPSAPSSQSCRNSHGPYCPSTWSGYHSRRALQELLKPVSALAERVISEILPIAFEETEPDQARLLAALLGPQPIEVGPSVIPEAHNLAVQSDAPELFHCSHDLRERGVRRLRRSLNCVGTLLRRQLIAKPVEWLLRCGSRLASTSRSHTR